MDKVRHHMSPLALADAIGRLKASSAFLSAPLTVEELEAGLRMLDRGDVDTRFFWERNVAAFRNAVLIAIRETSDILVSEQIPRLWREELESQIEALQEYVTVADVYLAGRAPSRARLN